jgi:hypothetical protein
LRTLVYAGFVIPSDDEPVLADNALCAIMERENAATITAPMAHDQAVEPRPAYEDAGGGMLKVFFTYAMFARVSATMSLFGEPVSSTYQPR